MSNYTTELKGEELKKYIAKRFPKVEPTQKTINMNVHTHQADTDFINHIADNIENHMGLNFDDLHHFLFNEDYYIIGYYQAEQFIKENDLNTFDLISYCQEQEKEHFGEIHSTFDNAEKLVNHYAYWRGQELIYNIKAIENFRGEKITKKLVIDVEEEIRERS